ncbi:MAG: GHKL domain-containing protein [Epsilonproteobacteria bacterium]|nr:GHKL domain-containing protein [Campylobacterota bacterium]
MRLKQIAKYENFFIDYQGTLKDAIVKMNLNRNGSVVLIQEHAPVAILTQSDIINALGQKIDLTIKAYQYATKLLVYINEHSSFEFALKVLSEHNIRRIVLVDRHQHFSGVILQETLFDHMGEDIYKVGIQQEIDKQIAKRLEEEYLLMQQSKLATMGEMIGHIAHQWRQPLAQLGGVFMNLDSAYEFDELDRDYLKERIKEGNKLIKYMSHTIEDFRNFFVPDREKEQFELSQYIQSAMNIIEAALTYYHIEVEVITPNEPIYVTGYPSEFSQVILNLLDNAKDVLIEREISSPKITIESQSHGEGAIISIKDNAGGIDEKIIDKIFDIYFSTKLKKGGSGLGLYISKLIIERKGMGKLHVSNGEEGAIFSILLQSDNIKI